MSNTSALGVSIYNLEHIRNAPGCMPLSVQRELYKRTNAQVTLLYQYMLSCSKDPLHVFTDVGTAHALGWSTQMVQRARLKLVGIGWYRTRWYPTTDGVRVCVQYIGPCAEKGSCIDKAMG